MNNFDVARAFINGKQASTKNFMSTGNVLYSYSTAIAKRYPDGSIIINKKNYCNTTNNHLELLRRSIPEHTYVSYVAEKDRGYDFNKDNDNMFKKKLRR
jgi:hypothetical protein